MPVATFKSSDERRAAVLTTDGATAQVDFVEDGVIERSMDYVSGPAAVLDALEWVEGEDQP